MTRRRSGIRRSASPSSGTRLPPRARSFSVQRLLSPSSVHQVAPGSRPWPRPACASASGTCRGTPRSAAPWRAGRRAGDGPRDAGWWRRARRARGSASPGGAAAPASPRRAGRPAAIAARAAASSWASAPRSSASSAAASSAGPSAPAASSSRTVHSKRPPASFSRRICPRYWPTAVGSGAEARTPKRYWPSDRHPANSTARHVSPCRGQAVVSSQIHDGTSAARASLGRSSSNAGSREDSPKRSAIASTKSERSRLPARPGREPARRRLAGEGRHAQRESCEAKPQAAAA